jgi:hypothetical protein
MQIRNQKHFFGGMLFFAFGLLFAGVGMRYQFGTAAEMGPGYFPTVLGAILAVLGVLISVGAMSRHTEQGTVERFQWKVLLLVLGSVTLFGVLLKAFGLVVSLFVLIATSSFASPEATLKSAFLNALVLIALCAVIFVWALGLNFSLWPAFAS